MVRFDIPGGVYADALPGGLFACVLPAQHAMATHLGLVALPLEFPHDDGPRAMFTRIAAHPFRIAVKAHDTGIVWTWSESVARWTPTGAISQGVQGHGWTPDGFLTVLAGAPDQDSQGLRYYDPQAGPDSNLDVTGRTPGWVTGSPTYGPESALARRLGVVGLWEWTALDDGLFIGQGEHGGCLVQHPALGLLVLAEDAARFIQAHRAGDAIVVAFSVLSRDPAQQRGVVIRLTVAEIADLPAYVPPQTPPPDVPPPVDDPPKEIPVELTAAESETIERFFATFGLPIFNDANWEDEAVKVAGRQKMTQLAETMKARHPSPHFEFGCKDAGGNRPQSPDSIARRMATGTIWSYDLIVHHGGSNQYVNAHAAPENISVSGQHFIEVQAFDHLGVEQPPNDPPTDPPDVPPPSVDLTPVLARVDALHPKLDALIAAVLALGHEQQAKGYVSVEEAHALVDGLKRWIAEEERPQLEAAFVRAAKTIKPKLW